MSSDELMDIADIYDDVNQKQFRGPVKFTSKVDPLDMAEFSVRDPTVVDMLKEQSQGREQVVQELAPPLLPKVEQRRKSKLIQATPPQEYKEEKQQEPPHDGKNLFKIIMAKSYFNNFVENLLSKSYVKKPKHFTVFQNNIMDDLTYFMSHKKQNAQWILKCKNFKLQVLEQSSILVIIWQILHIATILLIMFWVPFNIAFGITYQDHLFSFITVQDIEYYFIFSILFDSLISINTTYIEKGVIIRSRRKIFENFLSTQAIYDLISFVALLVATQLTLSEYSDKLGWSTIPYTIFYLVRIMKLSIVLQRILEFFNFDGWVQDILELVKLLYMIVYVGHLFACLWHSVAFYNKSEFTWIYDQNIEGEPNIIRYNYAFYWAVQTMITVGYGDISPQNNYERLTANISMFIACGVFAFSFNSIGMMLSNLNSRKVQYTKSSMLLNQYMTKNQIKADLQSRVRNYYDYIFQEEQEINDEEVQTITSKLSSHLQDELKFEIRLNTIKSNVLAKFSQKTLKQLSLLIEEVRFSPEDQIIQQRVQDDCSLYIITKGEIKIYFHDEQHQMKNTRTLTNLVKGQSFGECAFFTGGPRTASARSIGFTRAYKIKRESFLQILQWSPQDTEKFCQIKDDILFYQNYATAKLSCYSCQKTTHLIGDCPSIHFVADKEGILKKDAFPSSQERKSNYVRLKSSRHYFPALLEQKKMDLMIKDYQQQNENVVVDEYESIYDDEEIEEDEGQQTIVSKTQSKVSRQQSNNRSYSQEPLSSNMNNNALHVIAESENSSDGVSPNKLTRRQNVKQTVTTAGFGNADSINFKFQQEDQQTQNLNQQTIQSRADDHNFSLKLPMQLDSKQNIKSSSQISQGRAKKREESLKIISQRSIHHEKTRKLNHRLREHSQEIMISPSAQSNDITRPDLKKRSTKTNRTRTARTNKSFKEHNQTNYFGDISIPVMDGNFSMELEQFEDIREYKAYFPWNNYIQIVQRANRLFRMWEKKRKVISDFSLYTFSAFAMNKALRMRKKIKYIDEPQTLKDQTMKQTINQTLNKTVSKQKQSFRGSQDDSVQSLLKRNQSSRFGTFNQNSQNSQNNSQSFSMNFGQSVKSRPEFQI